MLVRLVRTLIGAAVFLAGYAMQEDSIAPFAGAQDPRFLGLLLEGLGLLILLTPLLRRRRRPPDLPYPRIRREHLRPPCCSDKDEPELPEPDDRDDPKR